PQAKMGLAVVRPFHSPPNRNAVMIRRNEVDAPVAAQFPQRRLRRLRMTPQMRALVSETRLDLSDLVYPMFACPGKGVRKEVASMPGVANLSVDLVVEECRRVADLGIPAVLFFGIPESKDEQATGAWSDDGIVQRAIRAVKE